MIEKRFVVSLVLLFLASLISAQNGFIRGTVYDNGNGDALPGVSIVVDGTTTGTLTDLDGRFSLSIAPGKYKIRISFISFETLFIEDVEVKPSAVTLFDNLRLKEVTFELSSVTITSKAVRNTENAILAVKHKSINLMDGVSAASFRKTGDSDAAASMKRVTGVSVTGGKYVFVRGLGDRYTKTILNGIDIPGLDPDRNTLQMDLFPTSVIDNIIVRKSFTADLPADFTGGVIDIGLKDFPEELKGAVSVSAGYNSTSHFNDNYLTYNGGKMDFLGFDDGTRDIPAEENIPLFADVVGDVNGADAQRYKEILGAFNPTMAAFKDKSMMDYGFGFSLGNQLNGKKLTWGYNAVFSYKNNTEFYEKAEYGRYGLEGDPGIYEMDVRELQTGDYGVNSVLWSGLAGLAAKTKYSKFRLYFLRLQNGESKAGIFDYRNSDQGAVFESFQHNLDYSERSLTNILLDGKHSLKNDKWNIEWKLSPTLSKMYDPDVRFTRYEIIEEGFVIGTESGFPERIWRNLEEVNLSGLVHVTNDFKFRSQSAKLKFGGGYTFKERDFVVRNYALNIRNISLSGNPDELFYPENLWPKNGSASSGTTYEVPFIPVNPNQFNSTISTVSGFASMEMSLVKALKTIVGVRLENFVQRYTGQDQLGTKVLDNDKVLDNLDLFPTLSIIYSFSEKQNLRMAFAKTIARPSFKELSYAEIYDPITGRTFIGGLFRDANDIAGTEYWDGNLISTDIYNFDVRWENYLSDGQTFSLGGFYKYFINPIEIVQFATQAGAFQPRNVGNGNVLGLEFEVRKNFLFIHPSLKNLYFSANLTLTQSRIEMSKTEYDSRLENARTGETVESYRVMAGQSPIIVNCGFSYTGSENGFWKGFETGLFYNVQGRTLQFVGIADRPDIYARSFHSLNFNADKKIGEQQRLQIGMKVENILNDVNESVFVSYKAADQYFTRLSSGTTFSVRLSWNLF